MKQLTVDQLIDVLKGYPPEALVDLRVYADGCGYTVPLYELTCEDKKKRCNLGHDHLEGRFVVLIGGEDE